ncbi:MAG: 50S ribosomal protein L31 [bacterium]|nr:50S ribosomal protein L31 [bacterium]
MKSAIHPQYYPDAKITCACGNVFTVGATKPAYDVEICSACHPFYTGKEKVIDTAGRVERFRRRVAHKQEDKAQKKVRIRKPRVEEVISTGPVLIQIKKRKK